jgi:hypothetical protein
LLAYINESVFPGDLGQPFVWSTVMSGVAFFAIGAVKGRFVEGSWWRSALEPSPSAVSPRRWLSPSASC